MPRSLLRCNDFVVLMSGSLLRGSSRVHAFSYALRFGQIYDFNSVGIFPHRVVVELRELSRLRVDLVTREGMGELPNR